MDSELQNLDLIDLLSERHVQLRSITEKLWNDISNISISNSEWFIMARIYKNKPTISYVTKHVDISRQAVHKFIKKLESKGLVKIYSLENDKKNKCIVLTQLGEECYEKNTALKESIEKKITENLGSEKVAVLKDILGTDWGL